MKLNQKTSQLNEFDTLSKTITKSLEEISNLSDIEKIILFPDICLKNKYLQESYKVSVPSSIALTSNLNNLYPQLRSRGIGCGMILISTGIIIKNIEKTKKKLTKYLPKYLTIDNPYFSKNNAKNKTSFKLSVDDIRNMSLYGAPWVCDKFHLTKKTIESFYNQGSFFTASEINTFNWEQISRQWKEGRAQRREQVGLDISGNHFLEAQIANGNSDSLNSFKLKDNELVFLYHGSCFGLNKIIKEDRVDSLLEQKHYKAFKEDSSEYKLILDSIKVLSNFCAASRCLVFARMNTLLRKIYPDEKFDNIKCITESSHNMIIKRNKDILYRHNVHPNENNTPTLVSGRNDHASYLFKPGKKSDQFLNSIDHGIGSLLKDKKNQQYEEGFKSNKISLRKKYNFLFNKTIKESKIINDVYTKSLFLNYYLDKEIVNKDFVTLSPIVTLKKKTKLFK